MQALIDTIATMAPSSDAQRIFHGRGGLHPGCEHLALDFYPPVFVLTSFLPLDDAALATLHNALAERWQQLVLDQQVNWVYQWRTEGRAETRLMAGAVPEPHEVTENGARYRVHVQKGQNHGLFLDMAAGRQWVGALAARHPDLRVLNLFAYTCAFSVVALRNGARHVLNVDMSHSAIGIGQHNHQRNGISTGAGFLAHDIFSTWGKITRASPYDLVIVDPPSYQKGSFVATKDYARLMRRLPELLMPGGYALLCLNAPELGCAFLQQQMLELAPSVRFVERLANVPVFADVDADRSLKVLLFQASMDLG